MEVDEDMEMFAKAEQFLEATRKYSDNLEDIVNALKDEDEEEVNDALECAEFIFLELLKRRTLLVTESNNSSNSEHVTWLRKCYEECWKSLADLCTDGNEKAGHVFFKIMQQEGKFPVNNVGKGAYYFPIERLKSFMSILPSRIYKSVWEVMEEYLEFVDFVYFFWCTLPEVLNEILDPDENAIVDVLAIRSIPIPKREDLTNHPRDEDTLMCFTKSKPKFKPKYETLQAALYQSWTIMAGWKHTNATLKKLLVVSIECFLPHLEKPVLTLDFLMGCVNKGGPISLLALEGIFILVKDHSLEYPNIYKKLYSLFEPGILRTPYKKRLFILGNLFLSSTHLPVSMVASFVKRLCRLCLISCADDILVMVEFVKNLLIRHPALRILITRSTNGGNSDPFLESECDPTKAKGMESGLWELDALQRHASPKVAIAATFIEKPMPRVESDLPSFLEKIYSFDVEKDFKKSPRNASLTFEKPESLRLPKTDYFSDLWTI